MKILDVLLSIVFISVAAPALAWSEQPINLTDPDGQAIEGEVQIGPMAGWYCPNRLDAETILRHQQGKPLTEDAITAFGRCKSEVRIVAGVFPRGAPAFVKLLADVRQSSYFVPLLDGRNQQDARLQDK